MTQTTDSHPENSRAPWHYVPGRPESETRERTQADPRPEPHDPVPPPTPPPGE